VPATGERTPERVNRRNGYRERDWDTRVGTMELAIPKDSHVCRSPVESFERRAGFQLPPPKGKTN
jgi:transposase-like protein